MGGFLWQTSRPVVVDDEVEKQEVPEGEGTAMKDD
jgi:hypothetical protein